MISTEEAARRLCVSTRRVQELVKNGQLIAEKVSGVWLVDEDSVEARAKTARKSGGRPARGSGRDEVTFTLMSRTHEVATVVYSTSRRAFTHVICLADAARAPIGVLQDNSAHSAGAFNEWWRARGIPQTRDGLARLLEESGVELPVELAHRNLGLSLSDQYWINPNGSSLRWEDVNFFNNDFEAVSLATQGLAVEGRNAVAKPDNTSDGNLKKRWICMDGVRMLVKGATSYGQEPYNELVATALHKRLLEPGEFVAYQLAGEGAAAQSLCANFLTDEEEYVPALYVEKVLGQNPNHSDFEHYLACCESLGATGVREVLDRMIVCDDILANHDRHRRNFGIIRNVETLECRPAPIFDSGSSLWCNVPTSRLAAGEHSFLSRQFYESPAKQMLLVSDLGWMDTGALEGFVDEACAILARNDAMSARLPHIRTALDRRVNRMISIAEWS